MICVSNSVSSQKPISRKQSLASPYAESMPQGRTTAPFAVEESITVYSSASADIDLMRRSGRRRIPTMSRPYREPSEGAEIIACVGALIRPNNNSLPMTPLERVIGRLYE